MKSHNQMNSCNYYYYTLLPALLFDGGNHCQGSWIAASDAAWIHVSAWMQASWQRKANDSVGCLCFGQPSDSLKLAFARSVLLGRCFLRTFFHSVRPMSWKHWPIRLNSVGPSSVRAMKYSGSNCAWLGVTCRVISRWPCCVPSIWHFKRLFCLQSS